MSGDLDDSLLICTACGTQFHTADRTELTACRICEDPRQYVPPTGQAFTTLGNLKKSGTYRNETARDYENKQVMTIWTEPKFGIGQRAFLLQTGNGNFLWDLIAYLDQATIDLINSLGGLDGIIISHPHYYTTYAVWARAFNCPVYISLEDSSWICRHDPTIQLKTIDSHEQHFPERDSQIRAVKVGGHFPGSMVLSLNPWCDMLLIADSIMTVPSAHNVNRQPGTTAYSFMWSIPNMIPLPPSKILGILKRLKDCSYISTHGAFNGQDVKDSPNKAVQSMMIESATIAVGSMLEWNPEEYGPRWTELCKEHGFSF